MAKHTVTSSGLNLTKTGKLQYPKELNAYGGNGENGTGWQLNKNEPEVGQRLWHWSYNRGMAKNRVGTVVSAKRFESRSSIRGFWVTTVEDLNGNTQTFYENLILTEEQYQDAKEILL